MGIVRIGVFLVALNYYYESELRKLAPKNEALGRLIEEIKIRLGGQELVSSVELLEIVFRVLDIYRGLGSSDAAIGVLLDRLAELSVSKKE